MVYFKHDNAVWGGGPHYLVLNEITDYQLTVTLLFSTLLNSELLNIFHIKYFKLIDSTSGKRH